MANPSGTHHQEAANHASSSSFNGANPSNRNSGGQESLGSGLQHNPGICMDWTDEEQAILEEGLGMYAAETHIIRYAKIAMQLPNKTVRDVALRTKWMTKKVTSKRRKEDISRKLKDKKLAIDDFNGISFEHTFTCGPQERFTDPSGKASNFMVRSDVPPYATSMMSIDYDEGIPYEAFGGVTGELLKQNQQVFSHISANLSTFQIQDNIQLLYQTRDNILNIMNNMNDGPDIMKQMPPLPVSLNEELANTILPHPNFMMK